MIFITAQGRNKTKTKTILNILDCIDYDNIRKCKKRNKDEHLQLCIRSMGEAVCFISFVSGESRAEFLKTLQLKTD